jgi:RNA polymerase sigma factor for flagellar operon FliA
VSSPSVRASPPTTTGPDAERLFLDHLTLLDRIVASLCRRHGIRGDEAEDAASAIRLRLVENDYAILRRFRGESAFPTYLTVCVAMLFRDYRVQQQGRWRPSAAARRLGPVATRLEVMIYRQGCTLAEAGERLRTAGETTLSDRELGAWLAEMPRREPLRPTSSSEPLDLLPALGSPEDAVLAQADATERARIVGALDQAMGSMSAEDRLVLRMRFWEDVSVADIARALGLEQKPLYKRVDRLLAQLRRQLAHAGITTSALADIRESTHE